MSDKGKITSYKVVVISGIAICLGIIGLIASFYLQPGNGSSKHSVLPDLIEQISGIVIGTGLIATFWDLIVKRRFAMEVLEVADLADSVVTAGIVDVSTAYLPVETWNRIFRTARNFEMFAAYANTWREINRGSLQAYAQKPGTKLTIILPDFEDNYTVGSIALKAGKEPVDVVRKIQEAIPKYKEIMTRGSGCEIRLYAGSQSYAAYRSDVGTIVTLYRNFPMKSAEVPTFEVEGGSFGKIVNEDLDSVSRASRLIWST